jgi:hypothetical protein
MTVKKPRRKVRVNLLRVYLAVYLMLSIILVETVPTASAASGDISALRDEVATPGGVSTPVEWGNLLPELKALGVVDTALLNKGLTDARGYGLTAAEDARFNEESHELIRIDNESKTYLMYVFWALAFVNANPVLNVSTHMYANNTSPIGSAKYDSLPILKFTSMQQELIEDIALNSYRPCCNAPTLKPDCSHGFAALGLIEFLVSNGVSRDNIFKTLLQFNSYSFSNDYADVTLALQEQGQSWNSANATQIMGYSYSSLEAHQVIRKYLVDQGIYDPGTGSYLLDPLTKYRDPILILAATIATAAAVVLVGVVWIRRSPDEPHVQPAAAPTEPPVTTSTALASPT